jgi:hypothetical protein
VLRLSLHPGGLAPRIVNIGEWRAHLFERLRRQIDLTADQTLIELLAELRAYPEPDQQGPGQPPVDYASVVVPFRLRTGDRELAFFSTGTPIDITPSELAIEAFFPADETTVSAVWR